MLSNIQAEKSRRLGAQAYFLFLPGILNLAGTVDCGSRQIDRWMDG